MLCRRLRGFRLPACLTFALSAWVSFLVQKVAPRQSQADADIAYMIDDDELSGPQVQTGEEDESPALRPNAAGASVTFAAGTPAQKAAMREAALARLGGI